MRRSPEQGLDPGAKAIKINPFNRIYFIIKLKSQIKLLNKLTTKCYETINIYLSFTDLKEIADNRKFYDDAVEWIKVAIEKKSRWEPLLADLRANNVISIQIDTYQNNACTWGFRVRTKKGAST